MASARPLTVIALPRASLAFDRLSGRGSLPSSHRQFAMYVLIGHRGCNLLFRITDTSNKKYREALRITQQMRRRFLPTRYSKASSIDRRRRSSMPGPVLVATSEVAA